MRDEDSDDSRTIAAELRDLHHRIDSLKEEGERQYGQVSDKLHSLELALAKGNRFPAAAWVAAVALAATVVGTGGTLYAKLETTQLVASQAFQAIKDHVTEMGPAEQVVWKLDEKVKALESRIVGIGPNGWHRSDHEEYAKRIELQFSTLDERLKRLEGKR